MPRTENLNAPDQDTIEGVRPTKELVTLGYTLKGDPIQFQITSYLPEGSKGFVFMFGGRNSMEKRPWEVDSKLDEYDRKLQRHVIDEFIKAGYGVVSSTFPDWDSEEPNNINPYSKSAANFLIKRANSLGPDADIFALATSNGWRTARRFVEQVKNVRAAALNHPNVIGAMEGISGLAHLRRARIDSSYFDIYFPPSITRPYVEAFKRVVPNTKHRENILPLGEYTHPLIAGTKLYFTGKYVRLFNGAATRR